MKKIASTATFNTRLMVANGVIMSKLVYLITVWGGAQGYLVKRLQVQQLAAARVVCGYHSYYWSRRKLLGKVRWLSVRQLIFFHTVLQVWKVRTLQTPAYLHHKFVLTNTRSSAQGNLLVPNVESALARKSFMVRATTSWNMIPPDMKNIQKLSKFKQELKKWTKANIELEQYDSGQ